MAVLYTPLHLLSSLEISHPWLFQQSKKHQQWHPWMTIELLLTGFCPGAVC